MPVTTTKAAASSQGYGEFTASAPKVYVEDVFSTYLSTGNSSTQTITNGIDLAGKGGMVWTKSRTLSNRQHCISDTLRGIDNVIASDTTTEATSAEHINTFNSDGFSLKAGYYVNTSGENYVSWTFRKQPKFFDVVTYTGNGTNRTISHNLGSVPGCIIVKRTDVAADWQVYHRSIANTEYLVLNSTAAKATGTTRWNSTTATATNFSLGTDTTVNANTGTYVAYLFAHDAGGFGLSGTDNVISCGSYSGTGATNNNITLGYEPQWLLIKQSSATGNNWVLVDTMRGLSETSQAFLYANQSSAEVATADWVAPTSTGFRLIGTGAILNGSGSTYIYIAIRRGPMKVPTSGTSVFSPLIDQPVSGLFQSGILTDSAWVNTKSSSSFGRTWIYDRLRGNNKIMTPRGNNIQASGTDAEATYNASNSAFQQQTGFAGDAGFTNGDYNGWFFRRAPGFFDVVCYTGTGSATTFSHNLGVVPELMIVKKRNVGDEWAVYSSATGNTKYLVLNTTVASATSSSRWDNTSPTSSVFTVGLDSSVNSSGGTYVAYLFATVAGVSKVGSYTGNGSNQTINCGFTGGARFVLIKRTDSTGDWYCWDSARGIVSGNDPHLSLNTTAAEVTTDDSVDTDSTGFIVNQLAATNINVSSASYIFLAVA